MEKTRLIASAMYGVQTQKITCFQGRGEKLWSRPERNLTNFPGNHLNAHRIAINRTQSTLSSTIFLISPANKHVSITQSTIIVFLTLNIKL